MGWVRVDDGFAEHAKILGLTRAERWTWTEVLCYCGRQHRGGLIPRGVSDTLKHATPAFIAKCARLGLVDERDSSLYVHDWEIYNGDTLESRVAAYLVDNPEATANQVCKMMGGKREIVLALIKQYRTGTNPVPVEPPSGTENGSEGGSESGTHARAPHPPKKGGKVLEGPGSGTASGGGSARTGSTASADQQPQPEPEEEYDVDPDALTHLTALNQQLRDLKLRDLAEEANP